MPSNPAPFTPIFTEVNDIFSPRAIPHLHPHFILVSEWGKIS